MQHIDCEVTSVIMMQLGVGESNVAQQQEYLCSSGVTWLPSV